jgi:hypothetical protein
MRKYSQIKRITSILLIFMILIQLVSCYSVKDIIYGYETPALVKYKCLSELPTSGKYKYIFIFKQHPAYIVYLDTVTINENFVGKINFSEYYDHLGKRIRICLPSDTLIKHNDSTITSFNSWIKPGDAVLSFPINSIVSVQYEQLNLRKTISSVYLTLLGTVIITALTSPILWRYNWL